MGVETGKVYDRKAVHLPTYLTMLGLPIFAIRVGQMAVLIPPATMMRQRTVAEGNIIVSVKSREFPSIVVGKSIPCRRDKKGVKIYEKRGPNIKYLGPKHQRPSCESQAVTINSEWNTV